MDANKFEGWTKIERKRRRPSDPSVKETIYPKRHFWCGFDLYGNEKWFIELSNGRIVSYNDGNYYYWPIGGTIWLAGAFIAGIGYAFDWASSPLDHAVRVRNYREWNANIIREEGKIIDETKISQPQDSLQITTHPDSEKSKKERRKKRILSNDDVYGK